MQGVVLASLAGAPFFWAAANDAVADGREAAPNTPDNSVYPASFFEQYLPQNALEMVQRLPGFNYDPGDNARGFGSNAGNVLVNGTRPTSKSGGLRAVLARIPTTQVVQIEILRGGISIGEAAGQSIVANVVLKKSGSSGRWAFKERWVDHVKIRPNLEAAISTGLGSWNTSFDIDIGGIPGFRTANIETIDADNQLISSANEDLAERNRFVFLNGSGVRDIGKGRLALNARISSFQRNEDTTRDIFDGAVQADNSRDRYSELNVTNETDSAEFSANWSKTADNWKWQVIGLGLLEDREFNNRFHSETVTGDEVFDSSFSQDSRNTEFIGRTTYGKLSGSLFKPEFGFEVAKNRLTSNSVSFEDGQQQELNGGNVEVEELRGEFFSTFVYLANHKLTLEGGLTAEVSNIKVSGDAEQEQTFRFIKPRISATFKFDRDNQLAFELERQVGQLDFRDFAASSEASDDRTTSGNPDLQPDSTYVVAATYDWSFSERGSLKVKVFHEWRDDILEQILLPSGGQGIGNAGDARVWGIQTDINLPLDALLANGLLEVTHIYSDSSFHDPIIDGERVVNGFTPNVLEVKLRQDLTRIKLAWGIEYSSDFTTSNFFVDEIQKFRANKRWKFFIESSRFFGVKTQLEITDANTGEFTRTRSIFDGDRGGNLASTEIADRQRRPQIRLSFSDNF